MKIKTIILYIIICLPCMVLTHAQSTSDTHSMRSLSFGLNTIGGQEGEIVKVTNLKASGKGSLRAAITKTGPRIVVFEVAGIIDLNGKNLIIRNPYITIAGQTAPSTGVTIIKGGIYIKTNEVIIQHLKVRPGDRNLKKGEFWEVDGISTIAASNVIIDHCSISWATDENLSVSGPMFNGINVDEWRSNTSNNVVFRDCIIAEGLSNSTHSKGEHSKGTLINDNCTGILIYQNLYANNKHRSPLCKAGVQAIICNNFIYNPGSSIIRYIRATRQWKERDIIFGRLSIVNNVVKLGKNSSEDMAIIQSNRQLRLFSKGNINFSSNYINQLSGKRYKLIETPEIWAENLKVINSNNLLQSINENVGAFYWNRDKVDQRILFELKNNSGRIIDSQEDVGGYPNIQPAFQVFNPKDWNMETPILEPKPDCHNCRTSNNKKIVTTKKLKNIFLIGDSTCSDYSQNSYPKTGWGTKLKGLIPDTNVRNFAKPGRSSKSFYNEIDLWPKIKEYIQKDDFVFIQFGHNDQKKDELRNTSPYTTYQEYLTKYLNEIRSKNAFPVLVTSINRNMWNNKKQIRNSLGSYPNAMKELAKKENVPLVDLNKLTKELFEYKGLEYTTHKIFMNLKPNEYQNYLNGSNDNSHLQDNGSKIIAEIFMTEIIKLQNTYPSIQKLFNK